MNRRTLIRVIFWQYCLVFVAALCGGLIFGSNCGLSCAAGGGCVVIPNTALAAYLLVAQAKGNANSASLLLFEFLKLFVACLLMFVVAKYYVGLNWPAMLFGIAIGAFSSFALMVGK